MKEGIPINLNSYVSVRLNDMGRKIYNDEIDKMNAAFPSLDCAPRKEDENGYSKWQLWDLMATFGQHLTLGGRMPFEESEIIYHGRPTGDDNRTVRIVWPGYGPCN